MAQIVRESRCRCGQVRCEAVGAPIISAICYCQDCQAGGQKIEALPDAPPVRDADGGTPYLTYRDDRFTCVAGAALLHGQRLHNAAPTQRFVATCCNTGMFLKFGPGHWVSAYRLRFGDDAPALELRSKVASRHSELPLPTDLPVYRGFPLRLFWRLLTSRLAMAAAR